MNIPVKIESFDGSNIPCHHFTTRLKLLFALNPDCFQTEEIKVCYMFLLMKGAAFEWAFKMYDSNAPVLKDFALASQTLLSIFEEPDRVRRAYDNLTALCQGSEPVSTYACKFRQLAVYVEWNESYLICRFRTGLCKAVRDVFDDQDWPNNLRDAMTLAIRIDDGLREKALEAAREQAEQLNDNPTPNNGRCSYCKKPGHLIAECRKLRAQEALKAKSQSKQ